MQCHSVARHATLGSYLRDALQEGSANAAACLPVPRAKVFLPSYTFCLVASTTFSCEKVLVFMSREGGL
jgi:hypothetical protein